MPTNALHLWFDPSDDDTLTLTGGTRISAMADKSGNSRDLAEDGTSGPGLTTLNGLQAVSFDGSSQYLMGDIGSGHFDGEDMPHTMAIAVQDDLATAVTRAMATLSESTYVNHRHETWLTRGTGEFGAFKFSSTSRGVSAASADTDPHVFVFVSTGTTMDIYMDGTLVADDGDFNISGALTNVTRFVLGARKSGAQPADRHWNGRIGEVVLYSAALSGQDLTDLRDYIEGKWLP